MLRRIGTDCLVQCSIKDLERGVRRGDASLHDGERDEGHDKEDDDDDDGDDDDDDDDDDEGGDEGGDEGEVDVTFVSGISAQHVTPLLLFRNLDALLLRLPPLPLLLLPRGFEDDWVRVAKDKLMLVSISRTVDPVLEASLASGSGKIALQKVERSQFDAMSFSKHQTWKNRLGPAAGLTQGRGRAG
ncbi:hypothetical protein E4U42_004986 [Claviceps africana]|uniref:Uncharacterized protein n=1 Tax=Claviceps africana TaxID=83212 RepID=A0A8K0NHS4_9HYPO|nr:hypothetical protein E4U42_004986 [Claviceps africana]